MLNSISPSFLFNPFIPFWTLMLAQSTPDPVQLFLKKKNQPHIFPHNIHAPLYFFFHFFLHTHAQTPSFSLSINRCVVAIQCSNKSCDHQHQKNQNDPNVSSTFEIRILKFKFPKSVQVPPLPQFLPQSFL